MGNFLGVFITPLLVLQFLGTSTFNFRKTLLDLAKLVVIPTALGQAIRSIPAFHAMQNKHKKFSKLFSETMLLAIVFNTFSDTFSNKSSYSSINNSVFVSLFTLIPLFYLLSNYLFWHIMNVVIPDSSVKTKCAAMICSSQKTLAFGIPFINTAFANRNDVGIILLPLLIYSLSQVFLSSLVLVPVMRDMIEHDERTVSTLKNK